MSDAHLIVVNIIVCSSEMYYIDRFFMQGAFFLNLFSFKYTLIFIKSLTTF